MHLVDDVDLVPAHHRRIVHSVDQVPYIIHTVVGRGIHLDNIQKTAFLNRFAVLAFTARKLSVRRIAGAVQSLRQNSGRGGLSRSPGAGEQVGVAHTAGGDLIAQGRHNAALTHHIFKPLWSPLAVQGSIHLLLPFQQKSRAALTGFDPRLA